MPGQWSPVVRHGIHFSIRHPHEAAHLAPLKERLLDVRAGSSDVAEVVLHAASDPPQKHAWNVQVFHGLGDKGYTLNPIFLQKGRHPKLRTALNVLLRSLGLPARFLQPPERPGRRQGRYEQCNAYGPRFRDRLEEMLKGTVVSTYGHPALNDLPKPRIDPEGPLLWLPTWDNRRYLGGQQQSSLAPFAHEVSLVSKHVPVRIKYHPLTLVYDQDRKARYELESRAGIQIVREASDAYSLLDGIRGVITDTSSIGFEAYCLGIPVGLARPSGFQYHGLHAELAERTPTFSSGRPDLLQWAESPQATFDRAWAEDLLVPPSPERNDAFAAALRAHVGR